MKRNFNKIDGDTAKYKTYYCDRATNRKVKYTTKTNNGKARINTVVDNNDF